MFARLIVPAQRASARLQHAAKDQVQRRIQGKTYEPRIPALPQRLIKGWDPLPHTKPGPPGPVSGLDERLPTTSAATPRY